ncbi:hypothetical protein SDC9_75511 [bioreactor metagenome]|uniref:Methyl-accepting transducer domain-containing protein n=1 Tax=bioreactor metagenome TaxID=1076179 RepID=A0A644YR81_9ZZZZ
MEAARAGQHGRGFAVVAQEVRTLAARSAQAAGETTELIERSVRKSEAGKRVAGEAAKALEEIVNGVEQTAALVDAIAAASQAQAAGIAQVKQGVTQVSQVVQATAATSEECAAASEELSGQSAQLKELISFFRIRSVGAPDQSAGGETEAPELIPAQAEKEEAEEPAMTEASGTKAHIALEEGEMGKY